MSLIAMAMEIATETQPLQFVGMAPNVCLVPAPPPPAGPQGIPTPFPIMTDSKSIAESPADGVEHGGKNKKVMNTDSIASGIKGNEAGVGNLPPTKPEKDILTMVNRSKAYASVGCFTVKMGGKPVVFVGSLGFGNIR